MITIKTTYEIIDHESAMHGDAAERGWIDEIGSKYTFGELVDLLRGAEPSCSDIDSADWATVYNFDVDYRTGEHENRSYHPVTERDLRYFRKALKAAQ